jgi:signal transduction histidine kinase
MRRWHDQPVPIGTHAPASTSAQSRLLSARVDLLARQIPALASGTSVLAAGTAYILISQHMAAERVLAWLAAVLVLSGIRFAVYRRYTANAYTAEDAPRWALILSAFSCIAGVLWGLLGVLSFTPDNPFTLAIVAIILAVIVASGLNSLGPFWPAHLAFAIPCTLPFSISCIASGSPSLVMLGALAIFFLVFTEAYARSISRSIEKSLRLRFENLDLLRELTAAKDRAEAADLAKTRLLAAVSHDLRQPLHGLGLLAGSIEAAVREPMSDPREAAEIALIAQRMRQDSEAMEQLVSRLLEASHLEDGRIEPRPQPCDIAALLESIAGSAQDSARAKGLRIRLFARACERVHTDAVLLHSAVSNLVSNAIKYTRAGGVLLACRRRRGSLRIEVWDTGIGIPPDELEHVLGEYYRARNADEAENSSRGFGLGLAIVNRIAGLLGLRLHVRSRLGRGSVFALEIPLTDS